MSLDQMCRYFQRIYIHLIVEKEKLIILLSSTTLPFYSKVLFSWLPRCFFIFPGVFICLQVSEAVLMNGVFIEFLCSFQIVKMCLSFFNMPPTPSLGLAWGETYFTVWVSSGFPWPVPPYATIIKIFAKGKNGICECSGRIVSCWTQCCWSSPLM